MHINNFELLDPKTHSIGSGSCRQSATKDFQEGPWNHHTGKFPTDSSGTATVGSWKEIFSTSCNHFQSFRIYSHKYRYTKTLSHTQSNKTNTQKHSHTHKVTRLMLKQYPNTERKAKFWNKGDTTWCPTWKNIFYAKYQVSNLSSYWDMVKTRFRYKGDTTCGCRAIWYLD